MPLPRKFKVMKPCRISGHEWKPGDTLELPGKLTPARAEVNLENGNLEEIGGAPAKDKK